MNANSFYYHNQKHPSPHFPFYSHQNLTRRLYIHNSFQHFPIFYSVSVLNVNIQPHQPNHFIWRWLLDSTSRDNGQRTPQPSGSAMNSKIRGFSFQKWTTYEAAQSITSIEVNLSHDHLDLVRITKQKRSNQYCLEWQRCGGPDSLKVPWTVISQLTCSFL